MKNIFLLLFFTVSFAVYGQDEGPRQEDSRTTLEEKEQALFKETQNAKNELYALIASEISSPEELQALIARGENNDESALEVLRLLDMAVFVDTTLGRQTLDEIQRYTIREIGVNIHILDSLLSSASSEDEEMQDISANLTSVLQLLRKSYRELLEVSK